MEGDGQSLFYKSLMAGVFAGIVATLLSLAYNYFYREATDFPLSDLINVSSIIFVTMLVFTLVGLLFYVFEKYVKGGTVVYIVVSALLTLLCVWGDYHIQRSPDATLTSEFRSLFLGVIIISGLAACLLIPYLVKKENDII